MKNPIKITLKDKSSIIINEDQIVSIRKSCDEAIIRMSNGDELECIYPPYDAWENDIHIK